MKKIVLVISMIVMAAGICIAQQTSAFNYQGKLGDGGSAANGTYSFQFKLFDDAAGTNQIGTTQTVPPLVVTNGIFTTQLDFGADAFVLGHGSQERWIEISVRPGNTGPYTTLTPRREVNSVPFAVSSLSSATATNATQLGGVAASNFVQANDSHVLRDPGAENLFAGANSGEANTSGTGNAFFGPTTGQANTTGSYNTFMGVSAGRANTTGQLNSYFGLNSGTQNSVGSSNSFFGAQTGVFNTASGNSFFGSSSGNANTSGSKNAFFGFESGAANTTGFFNSFLGARAGNLNTTGSRNTFAGNGSGVRNTSASDNTFLGVAAGSSNDTGSNNTIIGSLAGSSNTNENRNTFLGYASNGVAGITNATAIGSNSSVTQSNSLVLGSISGQNGATANTNVGIGTSTPGYRLDVAGTVNATGFTLNGSPFSTSSQWTTNGNHIGYLPAGNVGVGTGSPSFKLHVIDPSNTGLRVQTNTAGGTVASFGGTGDLQVDAPGVVGGRFIVTEGGNVGIGNNNPGSKLTVAGTVESTSGGIKFPDGSVQTTAATGGSASLTTYETHRYYQVDPVVYLPNDGSVVEIMHLDLPGFDSYIMMTSIEFTNNGNDGVVVHCVKDGNTPEYSLSVGPHSTVQFNLQKVQYNANRTVWRCSGPNFGTGNSLTFATNTSFTAVRLGSNIITQ